MFVMCWLEKIMLNNFMKNYSQPQRTIEGTANNIEDKSKNH